LTNGVSVLVCCYNSALRLPETIKHLALQQVPQHISWEIIIIDNASTDNTGETAYKEWDKYQLPNIGFKVLNEPVPGKHYALNTGISCSAYEYVIICDDDNWLYNDYIEKAWQIMQSDPTVGAAGGQGIAIAEAELPEWFGQSQHSYAVGKQGDKTGYLPNSKYIWGAGMIFRKSLYNKVYKNLPSFLTGPNTDTLARGEDVEFCFRVLLAGYKLYYNEGLIFKHYLPKERLTEAYQQELLTGNAFETRILNLYNNQVKIRYMPFYEKALLLGLSMVRYIISKINPKSRWSYMYESEVIYQVTGLQLADVSTESVKIRSLSLQLPAEKHLQNA
jgi:glycosyltransferase involved in cell wall biosynthesis